MTRGDAEETVDHPAAFFVRSGSMTSEELVEAEASVLRGDLAELERRTLLAAVTASCDVNEAAELLGIDVSRVLRDIERGRLHAFWVDEVARLPAWQFTDDAERRVLPGLTTVVHALPVDMCPASVLGVMTTAQEDLVDGGAPVTPVEWLRGGGDPQAVVDLLESFPYL